MKKFVTVLLTVIMCLALFACGNADIPSGDVVPDGEIERPGDGGTSGEDNDADKDPDGDNDPDDNKDPEEDKEQDGDKDSDGDKDPGGDKEPDDGDDTPEEKYAKVVIMSGQSNMLGCTYFQHLSAQNVGAERYGRVSGEFGSVKILNDKEAKSIDDFVPVKAGQGNVPGDKRLCFGPELGMAEILSQKYPDETVYLIKVAYGGTSLYESWRTKSRPGGEAYCSLLLRTYAQSGIKVLSDAGLNPKVVGFCWMQGEADCEWSREAESKAYLSNLTTFVTDMRSEFNGYALDGKTMNFIDAYISDSPSWTFYKNVNNAKREFSNKDTHNYLLDTLAPDLAEKGVAGLIYSREEGDPMHYDSVSMLKLGNMFADAITYICG